LRPVGLVQSVKLLECPDVFAFQRHVAKPEQHEIECG
jgi:hypothetical protein